MIQNFVRYLNAKHEEWGRLREKGKRHYFMTVMLPFAGILLFFALMFFVLMPMSVPADDDIHGILRVVFAILVPFELIGGYVLAHVTWTKKEKEFLEKRYGNAASQIKGAH